MNNQLRYRFSGLGAYGTLNNIQKKEKKLLTYLKGINIKSEYLCLRERT